MANIENLDSLLRKIDKLKNVDATTMKGLQKGAMRVEADAKTMAPSDNGHLRASITHELDASKLQAEVGTGLFYAPYVEHGTGVFAADGNGRKTPWSYKDEEGNWYTTAGQRPQPFLQPSFDANKKAIKKDIEEELRKHIGGIGKK